MVTSRRLLSIKSLNIGQQRPFIVSESCINLSCFRCRKDSCQSFGLPVSNQLWNNNLLSQSGYFGPVDVVGLNLKIDWNFQNSNHNFKIISGLSAFVPLDSSGLEKFPTEWTRTVHPGSGNYIRSNSSC